MTARARRPARILRREPIAAGVGALVLLGSLVVSVQLGDWPGWNAGASIPVACVFGVSILFGEWFAIAAPGFRGAAPIATAAAFGFAFVIVAPESQRFPYGAAFVISVTALAMLSATTARALSGREVNIVETTGRLVAVAVAAMLYRSVHLQQGAGSAAPDDGLVPWERALLLVGVTVAALAADAVFTSLMRRLGATTGWWRILEQEVRSSFALSIAAGVTGVLVALAAPALGVAAFPLFLVPLVMTLFAFRRYVSIRATYLQSIRTLARLTETAGYTPAGHSERVAELSVGLGRELGLSERELLDLEYAALLHDIGQVALVEPIPRGATVLAAPADQRRIGADTVAIVRQTGVFEGAARILEQQNTPFRQVRELGEEIPLASRILKVANAFEDFSAGARTPGKRDAAIERIYLGLGYEYDPRVVDALLHRLGSTVGSQAVAVGR